MRMGRFANVRHVPLVPVYKPIATVRMPHTFAKVRVGCRQTVVRGRRVRPAAKAANTRKTRDVERRAIDPRRPQYTVVQSAAAVRHLPVAAVPTTIYPTATLTNPRHGEDHATLALA